MNGRVAVVGELVNLSIDKVEIDGNPVQASNAETTILLNKPAGYLVSRRDPYHSRTVYDLLPETHAHLFPVGRLDLNTEGMLLLTNDGQLTERITHPRYGVDKTYRALVRGTPDTEVLHKLETGVPVEGKPTAPARARIVTENRDRAWPPMDGESEIEIIIHEGRKREVRLMLEGVGYHVRRLRRVRLGGLDLGSLKQGQWRVLTQREIDRLRSAANMKKSR